MTNPVTPAGAPVPPAGGGMPKWLIVLLVIGLVVVLGCCGAFSACWFFAKHAAQGVGQLGQAIQQQAIAEAKKQGVEADMTGNGLALPDNFPGDVPVYSGFKAFYKVAPTGQSNGAVSFKGKETLDKVASYYDSQLTGKGWKQESSNATEGVVSESYSKDDQTVSIMATGSNGDCTLIVTYGKK